MIQAAGLCVMGALLALVVRRGSPETALLLALAAAAAVLAAAGAGAGGAVGLPAGAGDVQRRVAGAVRPPVQDRRPSPWWSGRAGDLCRDAGESALAAVLETAGALCALLAALPLLRAVLELLVELMR